MLDDPKLDENAKLYIINTLITYGSNPWKVEWNTFIEERRQNDDITVSIPENFDPVSFETFEALKDS
jgi:hypothetical protein